MALPLCLSTVIFDLDGTLTDPQQGMLDCLRGALRAHDVRWQEPLTWFIGPPAGESLPLLIPDREPAFQKRVLDHYRACYADEGWVRNAVYPGIRQLLEELRARGVTLYVCTSKLARFAEKIIEHFTLTHYFAGIAADDGSSVHHDKADLLRGLMTGYGFPAETAVMIGDRRFDIAAAQSLGIASVGVTYGYGSADELEQARPDALCASVEELRELLMKRM